MIRVLTFNKNNFSKTEDIISPTIFPDNTSQVWKLPEYILTAKYIQIIWNFETEREIIDLYSLKELFRPDASISLHIPYLPYARQDKEITNNSTFNLKVLSKLLNSLNFHQITSVDVHNPKTTKLLIPNFENITVDQIHKDLILKYRPIYLVAPDGGSLDRYTSFTESNSILFYKNRLQNTGEISELYTNNVEKIKYATKVLILDDICDGGQTFKLVAKKLKEINSDLHIALFVTHGIFSKGKNLEGIDEIFTTNSLIKNATAHYQV